MISAMNDTSRLSEDPLKMVIGAKRHLTSPLREIWAFRELFFFFIWRDIKIRYKQTILGVAWVVLQPLITMLLFTLVFGRISLFSNGQLYPVFVLAGLIPWFFFSNGFSIAANSLVNDSNLIKKIYFPRILIPLSKICGGLLDFAIGLIILFVVMGIYGVPPSLRWLALPILTTGLVMTTTGIGIWLSALNVLYRDIKHIVPFLTQIWLFATPVVYSFSLIPVSWQYLCAVNPLVGIVECFRWMVLGTFALDTSCLLISLTSSLAFLLMGYFYFYSKEELFADIV